MARSDKSRTYKIMGELAKSASKVVLILFAVALVAGVFLGKVSEETFKTAALMVLTYYFTSKGDPNQAYGGK